MASANPPNGSEYSAEQVRVAGGPGYVADPSVGTLISSLLSDTSRLVRDEVRLAKAEAGEKAGQAVHGVRDIAVGGGIAFLGVIFLLLAAVYGLSEVMHPAFASLIVGAVVAIIGYVLLKKGTSDLKAKNLAPTRTQANISRDAHMVKESV